MRTKGIIARIRLYFSMRSMSAYMDNELDRSSSNSLQRLLEGSSEARAYYDRMVRIRDIMKSLPERRPPEGLKQRIDDVIVHAQVPSRYPGPAFARRPLAWVYAGTLAAVLLAVITVFGVRKLRTHAGVPADSMLASIDMYRNMGLYEHIDMIEHLDEVMAVGQPVNTPGGGAQ